jgi:molecular chaperone GrpE
MNEESMNNAPQENAAPPAASDENLEQRLQAVTAERDDYRDKWARARADLDNYRKRIQKEIEEDRKYAPLPMLKRLLPALDGLDRALKSAKQSRNADELIAGIELVAKEFEAALASVGAQAIAAVGQPFDPHLHEAIQQVPTDEHPPMTVVEDVERGYLLHDRVVRPTKVVVSTAPPPENP